MTVDPVHGQACSDTLQSRLPEASSHRPMHDHATPSDSKMTSKDVLALLYGNRVIKMEIMMAESGRGYRRGVNWDGARKTVEVK